ncbi:RNA-guided endonuclease IscB [Streptomyces niger]|uniref:RNA-guided endonuclease IscB n=1 Tax=Streptomyces niger TaxID=66373 RepID=UPI001F26869D|nr:RNA-guided endonuclease IscB [Streptomyces niger]
MFVLDRHGKPLQPTTPARARRLLGEGRAVVHRHTPFVIRVKDRHVDLSTVEGVQLGVDPGSRQTGISVFSTVHTKEGDVRRGLYAIELTHRGGQIRDKLAQRAACRRSRRSRNTRYRAPRFLNRSRPKGWLAPSLRHRVDTVVSWGSRLARWAPVTVVYMEKVAFDTHVLSAEGPVDHQRGMLQSLEIREYLRVKWDRACAYCGTRAVPLNIEHLHPRSRGGSDRVANLVLACIPCNQAKGKRPVEEFLAARPEALAKVLVQAEASLRDTAAANTTNWALWRSFTARFPAVCSASGVRTKWNRTHAGLPKTHTLDALCVGALDGVVQYSAAVLAVTATGRGTYARTRSDKHGFPRLRLPRNKRVHGYATGDLARAVVPRGKKAGTHTGRVAVRSSGNFNVRTRHGLVQGIRHTHFRLLQRADGYGYTTRLEAAIPPPSEAEGSYARRFR